MTERAEKAPLLRGPGQSAPPRYDGDQSPSVRRHSREDEHSSRPGDRRTGRSDFDRERDRDRHLEERRGGAGTGMRKSSKEDTRESSASEAGCEIPMQTLPEDMKNSEPSENSDSVGEMNGEQHGNASDGLKAISLFLVGVVAAGVLLIYLEFILVPLIFSRLLVYVFQPFINLVIGKKRWPFCKLRTHLPRWAAVIVVFLLLFVIMGLLSFIIYLSVKRVVDKSDQYLEELDVWGERLVEWGTQLGFTREQVESWFPHVDWAAWFMQSVDFISYALPEGFLVLLFVSYMLIEYDEKKDKTKLRRNIDAMIRSYILAQGLIALISGVVHGALLFVLGIDLALFFGLVNFICSWIPNVGAIIAVVLPVPVILLTPDTNWVVMVLAIALPAVYQFISGQFIEPRILSNAVEIPAMTVMISLMFWGTIWGIIGAILAIPLTVTVKLYLEHTEYPVARFLLKLINNPGFT